MTTASVCNLDIGRIMVAITRRPPRAYVDFATVPPSQWAMHDRLENWAKWCNSRTGQDVAAGFGLHKSDEFEDREYGALTVIQVKPEDAVKLAKAIAVLPEKHRKSLHWFYIRPRNPSDTARQLGLSLQGLADMVGAARQMLINRGV